MFENCVASNLLVSWKEILVSVDMQRPCEKVGKAKCTAQTVRNLLLFLQSWLYAVNLRAVNLSLIQLDLQLCLLLLGEVYQVHLSEVPGNLLERFRCCFPSEKGSHGGIKWPFQWQHPQLPNSCQMPKASNQQMLKILPYFKLLSHYMKKIRQSVLLAVRPSLRASPSRGMVCLHLGRCAVGEREWGSIIWGR